MTTKTLEITDADRKMADDAIEFIQETLGDRTDLNDYLYNILVISRQRSVTMRMAGLAASMVSYFMRETDKLAEAARRAKLPPSEYVGEVGKRMSFYVTLENVFPIEGIYGTTYITKLITREGNVLTWFSSNNVENEVQNGVVVLERGMDKKGKEYLISATVKEHKEYKGAKQTVVSRCTIFTEEGRKLQEEKEARKAARLAKKVQGPQAKV